jgi:tRNA dimethylallyltransferase
MTTEKPLLVVIAGPTASGKTRTGIRLAGKFNSEIISCDSRQFYRELQIGTAMPSALEQAAVKHHFIGHLSIHNDYNVSRFEADATASLELLFEKYPVVFMVGGSGLYIDAVCRGIDLLPDPDPEIRAELKSMLENNGIESLRFELRRCDPDYARSADLANPARIIRALEIFRLTGKPFSSLRLNKQKERPFRIEKIGMKVAREELYSRINQRVEEMMNSGLLEEARSLFGHRALNALNTVGYKELFSYFNGDYNLLEAVEKIKVNTRRYAKRQMTWFSRDADMMWFHPEAVDDIAALIEEKSGKNSLDIPHQSA